MYAIEYTAHWRETGKYFFLSRQAGGCLMITWNYRVFREDNGDYIIREVFYEDDGSIIGCTENAVEPWGKSLEELAKDIEFFKKALALPVLTLADIPANQTQLDRKQKRSDNISHEQLMAQLGLSHPSPAS
jgi:hypothetical protein